MKTIRKSNLLVIGYFSLPQVQSAPPLKWGVPYDESANPMTSIPKKSEVEKFFNDTRADWGNNNTSIENNIKNIDEKSQAKLDELKQSKYLQVVIE